MGNFSSGIGRRVNVNAFRFIGGRCDVSPVFGRYRELLRDISPLRKVLPLSFLCNFWFLSEDAKVTYRLCKLQVQAV